MRDHRGHYHRGAGHPAHHHRAQHGGSGISPLRKYSLFLALALVFAVLPTVLVMHSGVQQCQSILARAGSEAGFTANPFSHYNLCKIRLRLSGLTLDAHKQAREHLLEKDDPRSSGSSASAGGAGAGAGNQPPPGPPLGGKAQGAAPGAAGATQGGATAALMPPPSPPPPSPPPPSPPPPSPPPPSPPPPSPPPPSPPPPSPPPPATAAPTPAPATPAPTPAAAAAATPTPAPALAATAAATPAAAAAAATPAATAAAASGSTTFQEYDVSNLISTEISKTATDVRGGGVEDWSDFHLPQTQADIDRLMKVPHVDECFYCKVCVPNSALKLGRDRGGRRRSGRRLHTQQQQQQPGRQQQNHAQEEEEGQQEQQQQERQQRRARDNPAEAAGLIFGLPPLEHGFPAAEAARAGSCAEGHCWGVEGEEAGAEAQEQGPGEWGGGRSRRGRGGGSSPLHARLPGVEEPQPSGAYDGGEYDSGGDGGAAAYGGGSGGPEEEEEEEEEGGGDSSPLRRGGRRLASNYQALDTTESGPDYHIGGRVYNISDIAPGRRIYSAKSHLPNCTVCRGCDHTLEMMASGSILLGSYYAHEPGGSPSWLFRVRTDRTASGWAVVKVWCVPVLKAKQRGLGMCDPRRVYAQVKLLLAQQKLTAECGMNSIVPKVWVEPLNGVMPGSGFHIKWLGLWADIADGVSVQNLQEAGKPPLPPPILLDMLTDRINHTELVTGAIFDLLFSQCDRHQQNIFLTETGKFWLIDNDQVFATAWRRCGIDSLTVPTTQKFMINHLGFFYVLKYPQKNPPRGPAKFLSPLLLMDYRCHAPGGAIGRNFSPQVKQCLSHLSSLTSEQVYEQYGYPVLRMADAVRNRSRDLLAHGYEWTLLYGQPTNQAMHRYKIAPKCCRMRWNKSDHNYECLTPGFRVMTEIPYGNAWHGGHWHGSAGLDTGSYDGGTTFLPDW